MPVEVASSDQVVPGSGSNSNSSASVEPTQSSADQSMAIVVAAAAPPAAISEQVDIPPMPPAPQQVPVPPPVAPASEPAAVYLHLPTPALAEQHVAIPLPPAVAPPHAFNGLLHLNIAPYQDPTARPRAPTGDNRHGFSCKECYGWFPTHQGLGGHVAGHKNRRIAAAAAAAIAAGVNP
uniref:C2H2-type domain-containing protein n=1 Tax=Triticum urartu TaxID=4572 RepID=A0A8R7V4C3_TRIUA